MSCPTIECFLKALATWQQAGYISENVWKTIEDIVDPELLPAKNLNLSTDKLDSLTSYLKKLSIPEKGIIHAITLNPWCSYY